MIPTAFAAWLSRHWGLVTHPIRVFLGGSDAALDTYIRDLSNGARSRMPETVIATRVPPRGKRD